MIDQPQNSSLDKFAYLKTGKYHGSVSIFKNMKFEIVDVNNQTIKASGNNVLGEYRAFGTFE